MYDGKEDQWIKNDARLYVACDWYYQKDVALTYHAQIINTRLDMSWYIIEENMHVQDHKRKSNKAIHINDISITSSMIYYCVND